MWKRADIDVLVRKKELKQYPVLGILEVPESKSWFSHRPQEKLKYKILFLTGPGEVPSAPPGATWKVQAECSHRGRTWAHWGLWMECFGLLGLG